MSADDTPSGRQGKREVMDHCTGRAASIRDALRPHDARLAAWQVCGACTRFTLGFFAESAGK